MYKVAVLMSTYNGEKYLREQIDSIIVQKDVDVTLFIRDDGSSDSTIEIIKGFQKSNYSIKLDIGKNVGVGNSFMQLVYDAGDEFDYYAFADQDDVWLPEKLSRAIGYIRPSATATLYASNQILVDGELQKIGKRYEKDPDVSYMQTICQNKVTGCTMVWNKKLQRILSDGKRRPSAELLEKRIHDVWVAMVAAVTGEIIYDNRGYIWYRQHENNVVGVKKTNILKQWQEKLRNPKKRNGRSMLCKEIKDKYSDIIQSNNIVLDLTTFGEYKTDYSLRHSLLKHKEIISYSHESRIGFTIKVLLGLF